MPAAAQQVQRLDDSTSPRSRIQAQIDDSPLARQRGPLVQVRFGRIEYRLATAAYVGRKARIYYFFPPAVAGLRSPAGVQLQWRGGHLFADGVARPGERRQVWTGVVREAWMSDGLDLSLELDARQLQTLSGADLGFESYFEIEVLP
ncbi:MAG: hypothetical protein EOP82_08460 [Variovorax sp.]|nr:MAG: hypothetical protein EOP82_08460 [Variovorax sp.]